MTILAPPDEEEMCARCGARPRLPGKKATWCRPCKNEWQREYRAGKRKLVRVPEPVRDENGCLLWQGATDAKGYGRQTVDGQADYAHRIAWRQHRGEIPPGMTIDHLCGVHGCVNVEHLEVVTRAENTRRAWASRRAAS